MAVKDAIVKALVESEIVELMVKTGVENVYMEDGTTTLAAKLAEMTTSVEGAVTEETMNSAISTAIDNLIAGAPGTYDTLKEIADYIAAHEEVTTTLNAAIGNKVDKVEGKGLSTNDYTTEEKNKLAGIAEGAQVNVIEKISVNGTAQTITEKGVNITVPTGALADKDKVSEADLDTNLADKTGNWDAAYTHSQTAHAPANAQENVIESVKVNGTAQAVSGKEVNLSMPVIYAQADQPANLKEGDLWFQIVE